MSNGEDAEEATLRKSHRFIDEIEYSGAGLGSVHVPLGQPHPS